MQFAPKHAVPIFPLPGLVLFPGLILPLHVFELRYRTMVREALSGERLLALALLRPGWEHDYHGSPAFFPVGCLARCEEVEWLPNDCYQLKVLGLSRVRFGRVVREYPYRSAIVQLLPQEPLGESDPLVALERRALVDAANRLRRAILPQGGDPPALSEDMSFEALVNGACMEFLGEPMLKLQLLKMDSVLDRSRKVRELIEEYLRTEGQRKPEAGERN
ncbi:MAG TPA: LON peptidase substrate-binding domain-containing protein [Candidatus Limnocylindria bacterium]|nr:LON peptidase substrate-binding domain-containing protein [Candidatus Limnocylindria bacterium]